MCTSLEFNELFGSSFDVPCFVFSSFVVQFSRYRLLPLFATAYLVYHTQFRLSRGFLNFFQVSFRHFRPLKVTISCSFSRSPCLPRLSGTGSLAELYYITTFFPFCQPLFYLFFPFFPLFLPFLFDVSSFLSLFSSGFWRKKASKNGKAIPFRFFANNLIFPKFAWRNTVQSLGHSPTRQKIRTFCRQWRTDSRRRTMPLRPQRTDISNSLYNGLPLYDRPLRRKVKNNHLQSAR